MFAKAMRRMVTVDCSVTPFGVGERMDAGLDYGERNGNIDSLASVICLLNIPWRASTSVYDTTTLPLETGLAI